MNYKVFLLSLCVLVVNGHTNPVISPDDENPFEKAIVDRQKSLEALFKEVETMSQSKTELSVSVFTDPSLFHDFGPKGTHHRWWTPLAVVVRTALKGHVKPLEQALSQGVSPLMPSFIFDEEKGTTQTALSYVASKVALTRELNDLANHKIAVTTFKIIDEWIEQHKISPEQIEFAYKE